MLSSTALTLCTLLSCSALLQCTVFLDQPSAGQILRASSRKRRANSLLLEEILPGDLERECYEESCSQEEAAEIFQTKEKTVRRRSKLWVRVPEENNVVRLEDQDRGQDSVVVTQVKHVEVKCCRSNFEFLAPQLEFWFKYTNLNPCRTNPCLNGGMCTMDRGHFVCLCPPQYHGDICGSVVLECGYRNGGCMQYCRDLPGGAGVQCGCADGFKLEPDGQRCSKSVSFPCGLQQLELLSYSRSLWNHSELLNISTDSWETGLNFTETEDELMTVNATTENAVTNETELRGEEGGGEDGVTTRIVGGDLEKRGGSPWQVLVHRPDGFGFCGGTLVSDRWVITAAHCMESTADHVTIGDFDKRRPDPGEQLMKVQKIFVHPHFHSYTYDSDIALLYLDRPIIRGPTATPACLPDHHLSKYLLQEGNRGVVTGWGLTRFLGRSSSRFLRKVTLPVVSYTNCIASTEQVITDNMYCAGYLDVSKDACSGDSGGPMVVNYRGTWFLTGVVSWGERCAAKGKYGVYTRLGNFLNWIRDTMERGDVNRTSS